MSTTHDPTSGGGVYRVDGALDRMPEWDPVTSEHLWVVSSIYRVNPVKAVEAAAVGDGVLLDRENLLMVTPVFCMHCEKPCTGRNVADPCEGDPRR